MVSNSLSGKIESAIKSFLDNPEPFLLNFDEPIDLKKFAADLNVLPLSINFSTCYAISPDGKIIVLDFNEDNVYTLLEYELDPHIRALVLCQGAKKYSDLRELMPQRPDDAKDCNTCEGTGIHPANIALGYTEETIVCNCGGLGWLPKDEKWSSLYE